MKLNSNNIFLILFVSFFISSLLSKNDIQIYNYILFGYDSNVSKISSSEELIVNNSPYISIKPSFKTTFKFFKNKKRKTKLGFSTKVKHYFDVNQKSNYAVYLNILQSIGNYQNLKFYHAFVNNIYLREFKDKDNIIVKEQYTGTECYFDLIKFRLSYESPYLGDKEKLEFSIYKELQYYNPEFTEYDLSILGLHFKYFTKRSENRYSMLVDYNYAKSLYSHFQSLQSEDFGGNTLRIVDRGYNEISLKFTYDMPLDNKNILGFSLSRKQRIYLSEIDFEINGVTIRDELHVDREHRDVVLSAWYIYNYAGRKNKILFSYRNKKTISPETWVEKLKSFSKFNLEYVIYFNKIKI